MLEETLKNSINFSLNSINKTENPNQLEAVFVVHDFERSWNNAVITKEVCEENMHYLLGQYICCKYIPREENNGLDALGSHEACVEINRDTGKEMAGTNTVPIGHITDVYIDKGIKSNGEEGEVFYCKASLALSRIKNHSVFNVLFGRNGSDGNSKRSGRLYFKKCAVGRAYRMHGKRF